MKLIIQNNRIAATATDGYAGPDEYTTAPVDFDAVRMGEYVCQGGALSLPAAPLPASCTRRQGRLALLQAGKISAAEAAIAAITDPLQKQAAQIEYEADTWERANPFLVALWAGMGGTPAQLDALFRLAVTL